jgi:beta-lactamase class A
VGEEKTKMPEFKRTENYQQSQPPYFLPKTPQKTRLVKEFPKPKGGRKMVAGLLVFTVVAGSLFWFFGSREMTIEESAIVQSEPTPTPTPIIKKPLEIINQFNLLTNDLRGTYGFFVYNFTTKQSYGVKENNVFPSASLIKLPVILTLYKEAEAGTIDLDTKYTLVKADKVGGAGVIQYQPAGVTYTYRKLSQLMGHDSDNTAFSVLKKILGDEKIQANINGLGMTKTSLKNYETSPADIGLFFRKLYSGSIVTREHRDEILGYLTDTFDESRIPSGVPETNKVAHKVGSDIGIVSDGGIVLSAKPYVLVIMTDAVLESEARVVVPKISKAVWDFEQTD